MKLKRKFLFSLISIPLITSPVVLSSCSSGDETIGQIESFYVDDPSGKWGLRVTPIGTSLKSNPQADVAIYIHYRPELFTNIYTGGNEKKNVWEVGDVIVKGSYSKGGLTFKTRNAFFDSQTSSDNKYSFSSWSEKPNYEDNYTLVINKLEINAFRYTTYDITKNSDLASSSKRIRNALKLNIDTFVLNVDNIFGGMFSFWDKSINPKYNISDNCARLINVKKLENIEGLDFNYSFDWLPVYENYCPDFYLSYFLNTKIKTIGVSNWSKEFDNANFFKNDIYNQLNKAYTLNVTVKNYDDEFSAPKNIVFPLSLEKIEPHSLSTINSTFRNNKPYNVKNKVWVPGKFYTQKNIFADYNASVVGTTTEQNEIKYYNDINEIPKFV